MRFFFIVSFLCTSAIGTSFAQQSSPPAQQTDAGLIARMTTPIEITYTDGSKSSGSGFFFFVFGASDPKITGPQWRSIDKTFVITNRHVIQPDKLEKAETLSFSLRTKGTNGMEWLPILIKGKDIKRVLHIIPDSPVDVAAIDVTKLVNKVYGDIAKSGQPALEPSLGVSKDNFPGASPLTVESGDDVIVVGYPRLFIDEYNKLPILKRGLLITPWGLKYRGQDDFLIDYKGFHGSSGSVVITKPSNIALQNDHLMTSSSKQFLFLGVYSGEPFLPGDIKDTDDEIVQEKVKIDIGQVWYYYTVQQTIDCPPLEP